MTKVQHVKLPLLLSTLFCFALVLRIELWTPMHSDDYTYTLKGISFDATLNHYMNWSGRFVADFLSSAVLGVNNHTFSTTFNAFAFVALMTTIWWLPRFGEKSNAPNGTLAFLLIFCTYWLGNPRLGETSFWIVGSANYMWTNVLHFFFVGLFLREASASVPRSFLRVCATLALATIAGWTNENTSVTTLALMTLYTAYDFYRGQRNWKLLLYVAGFAVGTLLLILAPGNAKRLVHFPEWTDLTLLQQIQMHLEHRMSTAMGRIWPAIAVLLALACMRPNLSKAGQWYVSLFAGAAFISLLAFVAAPALPRRSLNGTLVYLLAAISFLLTYWNAKSSNSRLALRLAAVVIAASFTLSYVLIYRSYRDIAVQTAIREQIIQEAIARGDAHIDVPAFHFGPLLRSASDRFDDYFDYGSIPRYYRTSATFSEYPVRGHYDSIEKARAQRH